MSGTSPTIEIGGRRIGAGCPTYIVAEMSANHGQNFEQALKILEAASEAGADAVKLQTYTSDTMTIDCPNEHFQIKGTMWDGRNLYDLYAEASTPWGWQPKLKEAADRMGLDLFSTPFDVTAVDFLEALGVPAHKVASFEIVDIPLLRRVARTGKPLIISTGMSTRAEIREAVDTVRAAGGADLALLKCTSSYPARPEEMNLRTIPEMAEEFRAPVGLSDHTMGAAAASAAVALGACIVEKHFTLSRSRPGPDSQFSMEPHEFKAMVESVRTVEKALGEVHYGANREESKSRVFRRSLFVVEDVKAGETLTGANVRSIRPGSGMHPRHLGEVVGRPARRDIARGTPLTWELVGDNPA